MFNDFTSEYALKKTILVRIYISLRIEHIHITGEAAITNNDIFSNFLPFWTEISPRWIESAEELQGGRHVHVRAKFENPARSARPWNRVRVRARRSRC